MVMMLYGLGIGILLIIMIGIFGSDWLLKKLPYYSYIVQIYVSYYGKKVRDASTSSAQPVVSTRSALAGIKHFFNLRFTQNSPSREE
jgi:hypothetical protein